MTGSAPEDAQSAREEARRAAARRRRRAEVFGDVLPESTDDDRDVTSSAPSGAARESATDSWLRSNVPPHHGT